MPTELAGGITAPAPYPLREGKTEKVQAVGREAAQEHVAEEIKPANFVELGVIVVLFWAVYAVIGYQVTINQHVIVFDALDRLTRAYLVWHNDPPKLAAMGFQYPPLTTLGLLPFAAVKPLASSLVALPVMSGLFGGLTIATLDRIFARCSMPGVQRYPLLAVIAFNPMFLFYATNGMSEMVYLFMLALGVYALLTWFLTAQPRFLVLGGLMFAVLCLTRYSFVFWAVLAAGVIAVSLWRRRAAEDEVEGSIIAFLAPTMYFLALWTLFNWLIIGDPFGWIGGQGTGFAVNANDASALGDVSFGDVIGQVVKLDIGVFPIAIVVFPALLLTFISQRNDMAGWLAAFIALDLVTIAAHAIISDNLGYLAMRDALPILIASIIGIAWLYRTNAEGRALIWLLAMAGLIVSMPLAWNSMKTYRHQNEEAAFIRALQTGDDQQDTNSVGGFKVGVRSEQQMAAYIKTNVTAKDSILTDNAKTFGVMLLTGRPQLFFDRIDKGDDEFRNQLRAPGPGVQYLLLTKDASGDLVRERYPGIVNGTQAGTTTVLETDRYILAKLDAATR